MVESLSETEQLEVTVENIGGLAGRNKHVLQRGLNILKAPNASGKSSFIHGIQVATMDSSQLKNKKHFLHSFQDQGRTEISFDSTKIVRRIHGKKDTLSIGGDQLYPEGGKASQFCIASEDNELLARVREGRPIRSLLLQFSDAEQYRLVAGCLTRIESETRQELKQYRGELAELKELNRELEKKEEKLKEKEVERQELPELDKEKIKKNQELFAELEQLTDELVESGNNLSELRTKEEDRSRDKSITETRLKQINKKIERFEEEHPIVEDEIEELIEKEKVFNEELGEVESRLAGISKELERADELLIDYQNTEREECMMCGQPITEKLLVKRIKNLEDEQKDKRTESRSLKEELDKIKREREALDEERRKQKNVYSKQHDILQKDLNRIEQEIKKFEKEIEELEDKERDLEKEIKKVKPKIDEEIFEYEQRKSEIDRDIGRLDSQTESLRSRIDEKKGVRSKIDDLSKRVDYYSGAAGYAKGRAEELEKSVKNMFNENIDEVYSLLEFDELFESIQLNPNFELKIYRKFERRKKEDSIQTLSRSEKETIGLILMLAGRKAYCDDFPFFVADETTFYDPSRLKKILEYIGERVPFTVVTTLASLGEQKRITVEHDLKEL